MVGSIFASAVTANTAPPVAKLPSTVRSDTFKILYVMNYVVCKMNVMKHQYLIMQFLLKITGDINSNINNIDRKDYKLYLRNLLKEIFLHLLTEDEKEDFRKFLKEVFEMKDYN